MIYVLGQLDNQEKIDEEAQSELFTIASILDEVDVRILAQQAAIEQLRQDTRVSLSHLSKVVESL
jgi:hypothetical protein